MMNKANKIPPAFAKVTKDKMLLCTLCGELVKNESQWNLKHIRSQMHIKHLKDMKESLVKGKESGDCKKNEEIGEDEGDSERRRKEKEKEIEEEKNHKDILMKKALGKIDIDGTGQGLPVDFFEMKTNDEGGIKKKEIIKTGDIIDIKIKGNELKIDNHENDNNKRENDNHVNNKENDDIEDELREHGKLEEETDEMINSAKIIDSIINHYKIKQKTIISYNNNNPSLITDDKKEEHDFLNKKRHNPSLSIITDKKTSNDKKTKKALLSDILNEEW